MARSRTALYVGAALGAGILLLLAGAITLHALTIAARSPRALDATGAVAVAALGRAHSTLTWDPQYKQKMATALHASRQAARRVRDALGADARLRAQVLSVSEDADRPFISLTITVTDSHAASSVAQVLGDTLALKPHKGLKELRGMLPVNGSPSAVIVRMRTAEEARVADATAGPAPLTRRAAAALLAMDDLFGPTHYVVAKGALDQATQPTALADAPAADAPAADAFAPPSTKPVLCAPSVAPPVPRSG